MWGGRTPRASHGRASRRASANAGALAASAPPITKASVASQSPATSRKPSTLAGFVMPETASPTPKSDAEQRGRPRARARVRHQTPEQMAHHEHDGGGHRHEDAVAATERREPRAIPHTPWPLVQPLAELRAEADQEAARHEQRRARGDREAVEIAARRREPRAERKPDEEGEAPATSPRSGRERSAEDAADPGDPAEDEQQPGRASPISAPPTARFQESSSPASERVEGDLQVGDSVRLGSGSSPARMFTWSEGRISAGASSVASFARRNAT